MNTLVGVVRKDWKVKQKMITTHPEYLIEEAILEQNISEQLSRACFFEKEVENEIEFWKERAIKLAKLNCTYTLRIVGDEKFGFYYGSPDINYIYILKE